MTPERSPSYSGQILIDGVFYSDWNRAHYAVLKRPFTQNLRELLELIKDKKAEPASEGGISLENFIYYRKQSYESALEEVPELRRDKVKQVVQNGENYTKRYLPKNAPQEEINLLIRYIMCEAQISLANEAIETEGTFRTRAMKSSLNALVREVTAMRIVDFHESFQRKKLEDALK